MQETEKSMLDRAIEFARKSHEGQFRKWGEGQPEPYINHPIRVMEHCKFFTSDQDTLAAAVLHDVVEDCGVTLQTIRNLFGTNISLLVWELTNPSKSFPRASQKREESNE